MAVSDNANTPFRAFEKCANYSVLSILVMTTLKSIARFRGVPEDKMITGIYSELKEKAAENKA